MKEKLQVDVLDTEVITKVRNLEVWAKTGEKPEPVPQSVGNDGQLLPYGSILNFHEVSVQMQPGRVLSRWLQCRKLKPEPTEAGNQLLVQRVLNMGDKAPPIQPPEEKLGDGTYVMWSVVESISSNSGGVTWIRKDDMFALLRNVQVFFTVNENSIDKIFGTPFNGIRRRAEQCALGGHVDVTTMKCAYVQKIDDKSPVFLVTASVTPTVKTDAYWTTIMVDRQGQYLCSPYSGCDCPVGQLFCSHMLGLLLIIMIIQENADILYDSMLSMLPEPVLSLQTQPVIFSFLYN